MEAVEEGREAPLLSPSGAAAAAPAPRPRPRLLLAAAAALALAAVVATCSSVAAAHRHHAEASYHQPSGAGFRARVAAAVAAPASLDDDGRNATWTRVCAKVLVPGRGAPVPDGCVVFDDKSGLILYAGPASETPAPRPRQREVSAEAVMPGIWDCHVHLMGSGLANDDSAFGLNAGYDPAKYEQFAGALRMAHEAVFAGVTSVREVGGAFGQALSHLIDGDAKWPGPHIHHAGRAIGMSGGHTDNQLLPLQVMDGEWGHFESFGVLCDGVAACTRAVREQLRRQADVIKVMTSGGVLSEFDLPTDQELSLEEVRAITSEAARARRVVAAHAHGKAGIRAAVEGGVTTVEHGSYMTPELARQIKAKGMVYTPTCTVTQLFNQTSRPPALDPRQWAKGTELLGAHHRAVKAAMAAGVTFVTGTDCPYGCAQAGTEARLLVELYGMAPLDAIEAATANGPMCLGDLGMAPRSGLLAAKYDADVIALDASPVDDIAVLADADRIKYVWKSGRLVKHPEAPSPGPFAWRVKYPD